MKGHGSFVFFLLMSVLPACIPECTDTEDPNRLYAFVDDATDCIADASYCARYGMEYVCEEEFEYTKTVNVSCLSGTRVKCLFPGLPTPLVETPATIMKVLAYNVWELRYLYYQNGQRERTCRLLPEVFRMHPDLDVIVFNEVFMGGCFAQDSDNSLTIKDILDNYGFTHYTITVGSIPNKRQPENGGIFIASKWPINKIKSKSIVYEHYSSTAGDSIMQKGVQYAHITKAVNSETKVYHIFGTHLQAYERTNTSLIRELQAEEMYEFMKTVNVPVGQAVIYAGDLNADRIGNLEHTQNVFDNLNSELPRIVGDLEYTFDREENDVFFEDEEGRKWLDYVLYSKEHLQPNSATLKVVRPRNFPSFEVCMTAISPLPTYEDNRLCIRSKEITDLSDHYAVLGNFNYGDVIETTSVAQTTTKETTDKENPTTPTEVVATTQTEVVVTTKLKEEQTTAGSSKTMLPFITLCVCLLLTFAK